MLTSPSIVRRLVAGVFLFAAISKLFDFPGFVSSVARLGWLPTNWSSTAAVLLVEMEFITGLLLLSERTVRPGALLGGLMAGGFTVVTSKLLLQGISTECSCFGIFLTLPPTVMLGIDALLFFACLNLLTHYARGRATATESQDQARGDTITPQTGRAAFAPRLLSVSFLVPTYLVAMAALLQIGYDKERLRVGKHERPTITLRYGDRAPEPVSPDS